MSRAPFKVLVVDDDKPIVDMLEYNLKNQGYNVKTAFDGLSAVSIAQTFIPDLILLDIMMPGLDGVETCRRLRALPPISRTIIIFLTARSEEYSEIAAFDVGADDYITKPIKPRALMSRLKALLRRTEQNIVEESVIVLRDIEIDKFTYTVRTPKDEFSLPKKEFELLYYLALHPNRVHSRDDLLTNIWGPDVYVLARTVDVHIRKIREKIGEDYIRTVKGVGYKISEASDQ